jgi:hypothetical protein
LFARLRHQSQTSCQRDSKRKVRLDEIGEAGATPTSEKKVKINETATQIIQAED